MIWIPKMVSIGNVRLRVLYYILVVLVLSMSVARLWVLKEHTTAATATTQLFAEMSAESLAAGSAYDLDASPHCNNAQAQWYLGDEPARIMRRFGKDFGMEPSSGPWCLLPCSVNTTDECSDPLSQTRRVDSRTVMVLPAVKSCQFGKYTGTNLNATCMDILWPFVEVFAVDFSYTFGLSQTRPLGWLGTVLDTGSNGQAVTVFVDGAGRPVRRFEPSERLVVPLSDLLHMARPALGLDPAEVAQLLSDGHRAGGLSTTALSSGFFLVAMAECFNQDSDLASAASAHAFAGGGEVVHDWNFGANVLKPVCVISVMLRKSRAEVFGVSRHTIEVIWETIILPWFPHVAEELTAEAIRTGIGTTLWEFRTEIIVTCTPGSSGVFRMIDVSAIMNWLLSLLVLLGIPMKTVRFLAIHCLGHLSSIYKKVIQEPFRFSSDTCAAFLVLAASSVTYQSLTKGQSDQKGKRAEGITSSRMLERLKATLRHEDEIDREELQTFSDYCYSSVSESSAGVMAKVGVNEFNEACLRNEKMAFRDVVSLFRKDRHRFWLERLFMPHEVTVQAIHQSRRPRQQGRGHRHTINRRQHPPQDLADLADPEDASASAALRGALAAEKKAIDKKAMDKEADEAAMLSDVAAAVSLHARLDADLAKALKYLEGIEKQVTSHENHLAVHEEVLASLDGQLQDAKMFRNSLEMQIHNVDLQSSVAQASARAAAELADRAALDAKSAQETADGLQGSVADATAVAIWRLELEGDPAAERAAPAAAHSR